MSDNTMNYPGTETTSEGYDRPRSSQGTEGMARERKVSRAFRRGYAADGRDLPEATDAPSPQTGFFRLLFAVEMLEYFTTRRTLDDGDRAYRAHLIDHVERVATAP